MICNMAYTLLYEQTLAWWAVNAASDRDMPDPVDLVDEAVS